MATDHYDPFPWIRRTGEFELTRLFDHPGDELWKIHSAKKRICVLGGGIAGLAAAFELERLGHGVLLLEADDRLGGRILTDRFGGSYGDLGAMRIPLSHYCVHQYIRQFHLPLRRFVLHNDEAYVFLKGFTGLIRRRDLAAAFPLLEQKRNNLQRALADGIAWLDGWRVFDRPDTDPSTELWSRLSTWQYVQRWIRPGVPTLAERLPLLSHEEWEFAGRIDGLIWDEQASLLEAAVDWLIFNDPVMFEIPGGMDRLVHAFAAQLGASVALGCRVQNVAETPSGVSVTWQTGEDHVESQSFDFVICAVPAAAVTRIEWSPALGSNQWEALTKISYGSAAKVAVHCDRRLWEVRDGIFGGVSYTDLPIEQVWYPSDNAVPAAEQMDPTPGNPQPGFGAYRAWTADTGLQYVTDVNRWEGASRARSDQAGTLVGYMHGDNALRFASVAENDRTVHVLNSLEHLHPGISDHVKEVHWAAWDQQSNPGGGAYAMYGPGELGRYGSAVAQPLWGRVFFAGEHVAGAHASVQTSIQTALGAAWHVLTAP